MLSHKVLLLFAIVLVSPLLIYAQSDLCTDAAVANSFANAVALGQDLETWYEQQYANSGCPEDILNAARALVDAMQTTSSGDSVSETLAAEANELPPGFSLDGPGIYLFSQGRALPMVESPFSTSPSSVPVRRPQTINSTPSLLVWSEEISLTAKMYGFVGGIGVQLADSFGSGITVAQLTPNYPAIQAGIQTGDTLFAVNDTDITGGVDMARSLLRGPIGTSVDVTILRGSRRQNFTLVRQSVGTEEFDTTYEFWDDNSVIIRPIVPLMPGTYCYSGTYCFEIVTEFDPSGFTIPDTSVFPSLSNVVYRGNLPIEGFFDTVNFGVVAYLDPEFSDGWMFYGNEGENISFGIRSLDENPMPNLILYDPNFENLELQRSDFAGIHVTIPVAGVYTLVVEANGTGTQYGLDPLRF
jgi:hypothetical protein